MCFGAVYPGLILLCRMNDQMLRFQGIAVSATATSMEPSADASLPTNRVVQAKPDETTAKFIESAIRHFLKVNITYPSYVRQKYTGNIPFPEMR